MFDFCDRSVAVLAKVLAVLGGVVLLGLIAVTTLSVSGRSLTAIGLDQIKGDFEIVELGVGLAIFFFLPWTQYNKGHARVDMFEPVFGKRLNAALDLLADLLILSIAYVLTWRLWLGTMDKLSFGETTFILQYPIWQAYMGGVIGMVAFTLVSVFCVWRSLRGLRASL